MDASKPYFFSTTADVEPGEPTWFDMDSDVPKIELAPSLFSRPVIAEGMAISLVSFEPNAVAEVHSHSEEQIVLVLEGKCEFEVAGETRLLGPGMGIVIPPHVPHGARTYDTSCTEVDVFHPPRQALVEKLRSISKA